MSVKTRKYVEPVNELYARAQTWSVLDSNTDNMVAVALHNAVAIIERLEAIVDALDSLELAVRDLARK